MTMNAGERRGFWSSLTRSFVNAGRGISVLVRSQSNARVHLLATVIVIALGIRLQVTSGEWCFLILATGLVWASEATNTAIELLGDRVSGDHDETIGRAKDVAAGAVLLAAFAASAVGIIIFGPRLWDLFHHP